MLGIYCLGLSNRNHIPICISRLVRSEDQICITARVEDEKYAEWATTMLNTQFFEVWEL